MERKPDRESIVPPVAVSAVLGEYLDFLGIDEGELARRMQLEPELVGQICSGEAPITPEIALALQSALGRPAGFWLELQTRYYGAHRE
jgi:addiction module HigA family antidote